MKLLVALLVPAVLLTAVGIIRENAIGTVFGFIAVLALALRISEIWKEDQRGHRDH